MPRHPKEIAADIAEERRIEEAGGARAVAYRVAVDRLLARSPEGSLYHFALLGVLDEFDAIDARSAAGASTEGDL